MENASLETDKRLYFHPFQQKNLTLEVLPSKIFLQIFSLLNREDKASASLVNKQWHVFAEISKIEKTLANIKLFGMCSKFGIHTDQFLAAICKKLAGIGGLSKAIEAAELIGNEKDSAFEEFSNEMVMKKDFEKALSVIELMSDQDKIFNMLISIIQALLEEKNFDDSVFDSPLFKKVAEIVSRHSGNIHILVNAARKKAHDKKLRSLM